MGKQRENTDKHQKYADQQLDDEEYTRYGRQLIVPEFSAVNGPIESQLSMSKSHVLVVGAGGLGCPALLYLCAAGVGAISIVDGDTVEMSNLHRQILYTSAKVGEFKARAAMEHLQLMNPKLQINAICERLNPLNAFSIVKDHDIVLDCTDSPSSRYLINDVCVSLGKTIVSASGVGTQGQICVLNFKNVGPCYRCFYPSAPGQNSVKSCSDNGVIGPCIGLVGTMMAIETLKIITGYYTLKNFKPFLTNYDGYSDISQSLRTFKMRNKQKNCISCGLNGFKRQDIESYDYSSFCGTNFDKYDVLKSDESVSVAKLREEYFGVSLIDCRPAAHYNVLHLNKAVNIPLARLEREEEIPELAHITQPYYVICRHGNDSRLATRLLKQKFGCEAYNVTGGMSKWSEKFGDLATY